MASIIYTLSGQEQCLSGKPTELSKGNIVSLYLDLRKEFEIKSFIIALWIKEKIEGWTALCLVDQLYFECNQ